MYVIGFNLAVDLQGVWFKFSVQANELSPQIKWPFKNLIYIQHCFQFKNVIFKSSLCSDLHFAQYLANRGLCASIQIKKKSPVGNKLKIIPADDQDVLILELPMTLTCLKIAFQNSEIKKRMVSCRLGA